MSQRRWTGDNHILSTEMKSIPPFARTSLFIFHIFQVFKVNSGEYKLMGLAPYGKPIYVQTILENLIDLKEDGTLQIKYGFLFLY